MKQRILVFLTLAVLLMTCLCGIALAEEDPIQATIDLSTNRFSGPAAVTVTIRVTNSSAQDMTTPVHLYDPNGYLIEDFGAPVLTAGASKSWTGTWNVTAEQLAKGRLTYAVTYTFRTSDGMMIDKQKNFSASIVDAGAVAEVEISRRISPTMARKGQEVSVIYEIANVGTIDVTNVVIKEHKDVSSKQGTIALVKAGEKQTYVFPVKMGTKNRTSGATITYMANGSTYTEKVENATIKYGNVKLEATLKADKRGGDQGETLKLTLTLKNTGKADYQNVTVTDPALGTVFTGLSVPAGKTVTETKEITITGTTEYQFTVSGTDASGNSVETATGRVPVTMVEAGKAVDLTVRATASSEALYMVPGVVRFTVEVTNNSLVEVKDIRVLATGVQLYHFESLQPGETRSFMRDVRIELPGKFRFDAYTEDQLEQEVVFQSNVIQIIHAAPTPTNSPVPLTEPPRPQLADIPTEANIPGYVRSMQGILNVVSIVAGILAAIGLVLLGVGIVGRISNASKSAAAADHLDLDGYRDYTQAVSSKHRHVMPEEDLPAAPPRNRNQAPAAPEADLSAQGAYVESAMAELYPDAANAPQEDDQQEYTEPFSDEFPQEAAPEQPMQEIGETVTYRRRRRNDDEA